MGLEILTYRSEAWGETQQYETRYPHTSTWLHLPCLHRVTQTNTNPNTWQSFTHPLLILRNLKMQNPFFRWVPKIAKQGYLASSCLISGFWSNVNEMRHHLGYYAVYSDNSLPTFRDNISAPYSVVKKFKKKSESKKKNKRNIDPWIWGR